MSAVPQTPPLSRNITRLSHLDLPGAGQVYVAGIPSMRHIATIPVFAPYPATGYGFDEETKAMLGDFTWGDMHHPGLSQTDGLYDGRWLFVNDNANNRVARIDLRDFKTKQIFGPIPNLSAAHACPFPSPNTEYVFAASRFSVPVPMRHERVENYADAFRGIIAGIKVDRGAFPMPGARDEKITEGLDGLRQRLKHYAELGAGFAKWRGVIAITSYAPSRNGIRANAHVLARYAIHCQEAGIVPVVEPEVLADGEPGDHSIQRCEEVTAGAIRRAAALGATGPNQLKAYLRCGMGPCQGRVCAPTVAALIAEVRGLAPEEVPPLRPRAPYKPITVGMLAASAESLQQSAP